MFVCALRMYPANPGWAVRCGCVCLVSGLGCTPPHLAGPLGVCVPVCMLRLYPATPGWAVRCWSVCFSSDFSSAPPLLAWVLGFVCVCVRAPLVPCNSWLSCVVWVCVLRFGFRLRPATPGWGVGMCVCLCARSPCTPPLLAGVCDVGVCAWAQVWAAPRHSWPGYWGVRVFVCALCLYPAIPGWSVRCGCVCLGSDFGCTPPLLPGVLGCVCVCVRAPLVPRHPWLGCAVWVCVLGLTFHLRPATPGLGVRVCVCVCVRAPLVPRHSWLGCAVWVCVLGLRFRLRPATPGWVLAFVCVCVRAPLVPRHSCLGCAVWVCVLGLDFWLRRATPAWGVGVCVCLCARSACTSPLLDGVCGVRLFGWAQILAALRHSWLRCAMWVCVLGLTFQLRPATPGWGVRVCVCLCARSACTPPLLAGPCGVGVCDWARISAAPRHSWPGVGVCMCLCARSACTPPLLPGVCGVGVCAWARFLGAPRHSCLGCRGVCVFVCTLRMYLATPGWHVRCACVCLGSDFGCAPPLLAGCWGWYVFLCVLCLYPAIPGWGVRCDCVCFGSDFGCPLPLLPGVLGCVRVLCARPACTPPLLAWVCGVGVCAWAHVSPAPRHSWVGCPGVCVCLCARSACTPPLLAGVCGVGVCAWSRISAVPRHSWLGVGVCMCLCARSACTPPLLPGLCGVGVCAWARISAVPRHSWLVVGVCVCLCARSACTSPLLDGVCGVRLFAWARILAAPHHSWRRSAMWVCVLGLTFQLRPATPGWGVRVCVCLCARSACTPPLLAAPCGVGVCAWARISAAPRHSWLGVGVCMCLCARSACTPPLLPGVCGVGVCAWARFLGAPRHSCLGCRGVCVFVCKLRIYLATPGWGVRCACVCLGSDFGCARPLLAGCWGWYVFLCALRLYPATSAWGVRCGCVCLGWGFGRAPPLLAGCWGVYVFCVRGPLVPRHSRLGCVVWVCVLGFRCGLHSATPGWGIRVGLCVCVRTPLVPLRLLACGVVRGAVLGLGVCLRPDTLAWDVGVCVCLCARSACIPPLLAGLCGPGVCAWTRVSAAHRHSCLGCSGVRVLCARSACTPPLPAGVCRVGVCSWAQVWAAPRHSWRGYWGVCLFVCALCLVLRDFWPLVRCGGLCLGLGYGCSPIFLAGVLGCASVCVRAPIVPRHSWLGCAVRLCVLRLEFRLCPATPAWHVAVCVCSRARSACTSPLLAGLCVCVCGFWFCPHSAVSGLGVGARGLLRAPRPFPTTFWWGCLWRGGCGGCRRWGLPPPPLLFFFRLQGGGLVSPLSCRGFVLSAAACPGLGSLGLPPLFPYRLGCDHFFLSATSHVGCVPACPGCPLLQWLAALGLVSPGSAGRSSVVLCGGPVSRLRCCLAGQFARLLWSGCAASRLCVCLLPPPPFSHVLFVCFPLFLGGGVCLFLPLPSLGWCTHWSAFAAANRVAVGACAWLGHAPAPWVGWVMYTLGLLAFAVGLGSGLASREVAPGGFLWPWGKGAGVYSVLPPLWCRL